MNAAPSFNGLTEATANQSREELLSLIVERACAERLAQLVTKAGAVWQGKSQERASFLQAALADAEEELARMRAKHGLVALNAVAFEESALIATAWNLILVTYRVKSHGFTIVEANSCHTDKKKWISADAYKDGLHRHMADPKSRWGTSRGGVTPGRRPRSMKGT